MQNCKSLICASFAKFLEKQTEIAEMSKSWIRHGYNKVARALGKADPKNQDFPILKGHPAAQEYTEVALETHETVRSKNKVLKEFKIYRWSPEHPNKKPYLQSYFVNLNNCGSMVTLNHIYYCLIKS